MSTRDLIEFYRARLDEEEAAVRDLIESAEPNIGEADLDELATRRTVLDMYEIAERNADERAPGLRLAVQYLAAHYGRHADYREEFRPGQ
ncbi:DUF6221 family protein [Streptomyces sp. BB1-1-1]|uniref:DUF6221 family protein n=1 Tax=Streptomyces sp. BB1-1-1 TaxID=3074430 RepID=UPI0028776CB5|nr:DUF6221 family protein [Streptomyces sp. BB1-1-1]WND36938.1 DUF6221 family protein [Streptomyces sp. BB1-1-1]